jgi:hypothetical protein
VRRYRHPQLKEILLMRSLGPPLAPVVGDWYCCINGTLLEVVATDGDEGTIEVQHFDGTVEEFDRESWDEQQLVRATPPEDWTGSVDVEPEDYESDRELMPTSSIWNDALASLDRSEASGYSEWPAPRMEV